MGDIVPIRPVSNNEWIISQMKGNRCPQGDHWINWETSRCYCRSCGETYCQNHILVHSKTHERPQSTPAPDTSLIARYQTETGYGRLMTAILGNLP